MADTPKPGRARRIPERFEVLETPLAAHLTEEQKTWPVVKLHSGPKHFEVLTVAA